MTMPFLTNYLLKNLNIAPFKIINSYAHRKVNLTPVGSSFTPIYRFPFVPLCSAINKFKKIQFGVFVVSAPTTYICYLVNVCGSHIPLAVSTVGIASTIALFSVGQLFSRLIGYAYVSRNQKQIKLAYLDFWGKRTDIICDIKDITPIYDGPAFSIKDYLYKTVWISTQEKPFKINLSNGEILHDDLFRHSFYNAGEPGY
ncbi:transmembrane protein 186 [Halyomorpha halys]|uniref:transmembrane protein 186 n=1 Tax=Halyomorpha halys TaxID=286706 RepID=UPI0006D4D135|nr:transmembrane protein 186 [Halyomorpha halys]